MRRGRNHRERAVDDVPVAQRNACARHDIAARGANCECRLEDGLVGLLLHEQWNVLEGVVIVHAEPGAYDVVAMAIQIVSEPNARAEALAVVGCFLPHQGRRQRTGGCDRLQFLEGTAVGDVRSADEVEVLVIAKSRIHCQSLAHFPVILEVETKLFCVLDDERGIAHRDAHALDQSVRGKALRQRQNRARRLVRSRFPESD